MEKEWEVVSSEKFKELNNKLSNFSDKFEKLEEQIKDLNQHNLNINNKLELICNKLIEIQTNANRYPKSPNYHHHDNTESTDAITSPLSNQIYDRLTNLEWRTQSKYSTTPELNFGKIVSKCLNNDRSLNDK